MIKSHVLYRLSYGLGAHSLLKSVAHYQPCGRPWNTRAPPHGFRLARA
jgi:hypothetical protein